MSESELSDNETRDHQETERNRRRSMDHDDEEKRSSSKFGLKAGFGFRKKGSRPNSSSSSLVDADRTPPATSIPGSPNTFSRPHGPGPTPAQSAYIQRILSTPPAEDPLAKLRAANAGEGVSANEKSLTGLEESLQAFTSVEVLEGDNAFACRKCWKVKTGKYQNNHATVPEEDESVEVSTAPSIVIDSDTSSDRIGRADSITSVQRTHSPLRQLITDRPDSIHSSQGETDGLSDSSSDDEPPPVGLSGVRPKPTRRKSSHFVMRRAFKRYLIAQAPEVLVFHFKRFKQTHKSGLTFTSFYDLKK